MHRRLGSSSVASLLLFQHPARRMFIPTKISIDIALQ
jgi:hypothetical protein